MRSRCSMSAPGVKPVDGLPPVLNVIQKQLGEAKGQLGQRLSMMWTKKT